MNCPIAGALEAVGEWWTLLIIRDAWMGVTRFEEFQARTGIARNVLSTRLDHLVEHEILRRDPYDQARGRYDYRLTDKGLELWPILIALRAWGDRWVFGPGNEPFLIMHNDCGELTEPSLVCSSCGRPVHGVDLTPLPGPGIDLTKLPTSAFPLPDEAAAAP